MVKVLLSHLIERKSSMVLYVPFDTIYVWHHGTTGSSSHSFFFLLSYLLLFFCFFFSSSLFLPSSFPSLLSTFYLPSSSRQRGPHRVLAQAAPNVERVHHHHGSRPEGDGHQSEGVTWFSGGQPHRGTCHEIGNIYEIGNVGVTWFSGGQPHRGTCMK